VRVRECVCVCLGEGVVAGHDICVWFLGDVCVFVLGICVCVCACVRACVCFGAYF
jgi:hypothetical protein